MAQKVLYNDGGRMKEIELSSSSVGLNNVTNDAQIAKSIVTAKGDIITATGNATPVRQGVGSNGQIIVGDSNLTNGLGYKDPAFRNWVINGNMEVAQRGTSFTNPATGSYILDRFQTYPNPDGGTYPAVIHSQQLITPGELNKSKYFYRVNVDGAGSSLGVYSYYLIHNSIEHGTRYLAGLNKKITVSFYAKSSISNKKIGIYIYQNYGTGGSPSSTETITGIKFTLTSEFTLYIYTFTLNTLLGKTFGTNNDDRLHLVFALQYGSAYGYLIGDTGNAETFVGAGNIDIAQVALYAGDVAYPFEPVPFDVELQRCMRYYEKSYDHSVLPGTNTPNGLIETGSLGGDCNIGDYIMPHINFKVSKRTIPTINLYQQTGGSSGYVGLRRNSGNVTAGVSASIASTLSCDSFQVVCQSTRVDERSISFHYTADADF